jgi:hypothetical protein
LYIHDRHRVHCYAEAEQPEGVLTAHTSAGFTNNHVVEPKSVLGYVSRAARQPALGQISEGTKVDIPPMHHADREMTCAKCGDGLIAPEWSEFLSGRRIINLWSCTECGYTFAETLSEVGYPEQAVA